MELQNDSGAREADSKSKDQADQLQQPEASEVAGGGLPRWREVFHQAFEKARQAQRPVASQHELGKNKSKTLILLAVCVVVSAVLFLGIFSSPIQPDRQNGRRPGTPNLGRNVTPGQQDTAPGTSITPLLTADTGANQTQSGAVTDQDVARTARLRGTAPTASPSPEPPSTPKKDDEYAIGNVNFSDPALQQQPGYGVGPAYEKPTTAASASKTPEVEQLHTPSLVFVRSASQAGNSTAVHVQRANFRQSSSGVDLPSGTRLIARLESPVSTVLDQPVVAVIEYNYERDGGILVPAGARAVGRLRQADRNGIVDLQFDSLTMPDGVSEKVDGAAMGLDFKPLKGKVTGKNTAARVLVRAFTGLGTAAAYLVGNGGSAGFYGPISQSALLRERIANNLGTAGEHELNALAANQSIAVTVPGNTRLYIVLRSVESFAETTGPQTAASTAAIQHSLPTLDELRQLMQLRQELSAMYQQTGTPTASADVPKQQGK